MAGVFFVKSPQFSLINELGSAAIGTIQPYCVFPEAFGLDEGKGLLIFLPFMDMGSLDTQWGKLLPAAFCGIIVNTALAITKLHAVGVLHRDVAARNILLQANPFPAHHDVFPVLAKMCDLGLACRQKWAWIPSDDIPLDAWPPEVVAAGAMTDYASDVWAFGKLLLDVLQQGFLLAAAPPADALVRLQGVQPPLDFDAIVETLLQVDPHDALAMVVFDQASAAEAVAAFETVAPIHMVQLVVAPTSSSSYSQPQPIPPVAVTFDATSSSSSGNYSRPQHTPPVAALAVAAKVDAGTTRSSSYSQPQHKTSVSTGSDGYSQPQHKHASAAPVAVAEVWSQWCRHITVPAGNVVHKFVMEWCLRFRPAERPSMRMLTTFFSCVHSDLSALPDCYIMDDDVGQGPLSAGDWPMVVAVMKVFDNTRMLAWSNKDIGVAGATALGAVVQVRGFLIRVAHTRVTVLYR
jgi:hypothetical protein